MNKVPATFVSISYLAAAFLLCDGILFLFFGTQYGSCEQYRNNFAWLKSYLGIVLREVYKNPWMCKALFPVLLSDVRPPVRGLFKVR